MAGAQRTQAVSNDAVDPGLSWNTAPPLASSSQGPGFPVNGVLSVLSSVASCGEVAPDAPQLATTWVKTGVGRLLWSGHGPGGGGAEDTQTAEVTRAVQDAEAAVARDSDARDTWTKSATTSRFLWLANTMLYISRAVKCSSVLFGTHFGSIWHS